MRRKHAEHNEALCDHLLANGQFNDWVVTTAFYSAMHFVYHQLFPLKVGATTYPDFNDFYHRDGQTRYGRSASKHTVTVNMVFEFMPKAGPAYRGLFDMCFRARYKDYQVSAAEAKAAKQRLGLVKAHCTKP